MKANESSGRRHAGWHLILMLTCTTALLAALASSASAGSPPRAPSAGNQPPVITEGPSVSVSTTETGYPNPLDLTLHATDADLDTLTWSIGLPPSHGTVSVSGTGSFKPIPYFPVAAYNGTDAFVVVVDDGAGGSDSIVVNVTIHQVGPQPPHTINAAAVLPLDANAAKLTYQQVAGSPSPADGATGDGSIGPLVPATVAPGTLRSLPHPGLFRMLIGSTH